MAIANQVWGIYCISLIKIKEGGICVKYFQIYIALWEKLNVKQKRIGHPSMEDEEYENVEVSVWESAGFYNI